MSVQDVLIVPYKPRRRTKKRHPRNSAFWSLSVADARFSAYIRKRDVYCQHPSGCMVSAPAKLQCSHYFGRATKSTRFDPDNCIALCWLHHFKDKLLGFEYQKQTEEKHGYDGQYTKFMKKRLGLKRFKEMRSRSYRSMKQNIAIKNCMELLNNL